MRAAPRKLAAPVLIVGLFLAGACEKTTTPAPAGVDTTLVVVVDDFGGPYANAHEEGSDRGDKKDNCAYAGVPSNDVESGGATGTALPSGTTHGAMVASVLIDEINRKLTPATPSTMAPYGSASVGYIGDAYKWSSGSRELVVQKISVKRYKIEPMIQRVERVLQDSGFEHIIFNFSFIVAPCNIADWFATGSQDAQKLLDLYNQQLKTKKKTLKELQDLLAGLDKPVETWSKELGDFVRFMAGVDYEPLRKQLANDESWNGFKNKYKPNGTPSVVAVGAAGNGIAYDDGGTILTMRVPFPFMPAGWPGVLSVSASDGLTSYSNDGEEKLDGTATYASIPVKGTSFASPRLAAALGVYEYMTGANASCAASLDYNDLLQFSDTHLFENRPIIQAPNHVCPHTP